MRCPRCGFEGELVDGACVQCGYRRVSVSDNLRNTGAPSARMPSVSLRSQAGVLRTPSAPLRGLSGPLRSPSMYLRPLTSASRPFSLYTARSGDSLNLGRYRLIDQLTLPDNQQWQGAAWLAIDTAAGNAQVVIREIVVSAEERANKQQIVRLVALRLSEGVQHNGFPKILDVFNELDNYFIVLQHIEGESLASLLRRQGGALPERTVAEYGLQLCEMLTVLARQPQPIVHGAISPETVVVSPDRSRVHLIHLPLFPPREVVNAGSTANYKAPEQARDITDSASDLYSVAATMHHAVTGFDPRERIAFFYPPVRRLNPLVSQQMETILAQELRLSAPQRYARAADMQADLAALLATNLPESERKSALLVTDPLREMREMRQESRKRSRRQLSIFAAICLIILGISLLVYFYPSFKLSTRSTSPTLNPAATTAALQNALNSEWQAEAPLYQSKGIGISDGRYVFDTYAGRTTTEVNYKQQAAQALLNANSTLALNDYAQAVTSDKTDAEARIYYENLQIAAQKDPSVTIVLALPLDGSPGDLAVSRPDMQAAFAFQHQINTQNPSPLPGGAKLRVLIANSGSDNINNSGSDNGDVATVAQFIARRVQIGNLEHILAVVGWPKSKESENAISVLAAAKIPLMSQTASSPSLDGISPYFFRVNPDDDVQGKAQAQFAYQVLGARTVLVASDPNDPDSQSLTNAFKTNFQELAGPDSVVTAQAYNFTKGQTTVEQFKSQVQGALSNRVDLIFLPGLDVDAIRLAHALGEQSRTYAWSTYLAHLKILGGDGFDSGLIFGSGVGPDATLAQSYPQDMQRLIFTACADPTEGGAQLRSFAANWNKLYGTSTVNNPSLSGPGNSAIMVNDAFGALTYALGQVNGPLTGESLRAALVSLGTGDVKPYQGASGSIAFGSNGDPTNKGVILLEVVANNVTGQNEIKFLGNGQPTS